MRFDDRVTGDLKQYAKQAKVVHIEIDKAEIGKNVHAHYPVLGDAKEVLQLMMPMIEKNDHSQWLEQFRACDKKEVEKVINEELNPSTESLTMGEVIKHLNNETNNDAIIVTDVGQHQMVACRYAGFTQTRSSITSGGLGTMGFCLPAAIGAKFGAPERDVVAIIGDGGVQMTIQELGTILQTKINVKIIILNNEFLGMVRQWQELFFDRRYSSTEMINPDFMLLAKAYSIESKLVDKRENLASAVKEMMEYDGSYFLEVRVGKENNVFPMVPSGASVSDIILEKPKS
jgi:acetolactate synthase-1/2/3 large subunit